MFSIGVRLTMEDGRGRGTTHMNPLDRLLRDEMNRLLDRLGASTKRGVGTASARHLPEVRERLDMPEARLTAAGQARLGQTEGGKGPPGACEDSGPSASPERA